MGNPLSTTRNAGNDHPERFAPSRKWTNPDRFDIPEVYSQLATGIQRKASCACGGGCPSCHATSTYLKVSQPNDPAEIEADQIADRVMRMPVGRVDQTVHRHSSNTIQRKCSDCEEDGEKIQRKALSANKTFPSQSPGHVQNVLSSGGRPLDHQTRSFFEPRLGYDLSSVRIHTDSAASESAGAINARAYTLGNNIVFGRGEYQVDSESGMHLIAHELVHVTQQGLRLFREDTIHRFCINDAATCAVTCGQPGEFTTAGEAEATPRRRSREDEIRDTPDVARASGHSRRATNLETIARSLGLLPHADVGGIFVDRDMPSSWGAYRLDCNAFTTWVTPYPGRASDHCLFFSDADEVAAGQYLTDTSLATLNSVSRADWILRTQRYIAHEVQHVRFNTSSHSVLPGAVCTRTMTIYTDSNGRRYDLNYLLSEMSAQISEFLPIYNAIDGANPPSYTRSVIDPVELERLNRERYERIMSRAITEFDFRIEGCGEAIRGILRAIRCHCNCLESEFYIRDTFEFTTSSWDQNVKNFFNDMMQRDRFSASSSHTIDRLNWPLVRNPECYAECESRFNECTRTSRTGGLACLGSRSTCITGCR